jgi:Domain of unknown function (DUF1737)
MPLQAVEYHVVRGSNVTQLSLNVNTAINDGFQPIGGVAIGVSVSGEALMLQAVAKFQNVPDEEVGLSHLDTYAVR